MPNKYRGSLFSESSAQSPGVGDKEHTLGEVFYPLNTMAFPA